MCDYKSQKYTEEVMMFFKQEYLPAEKRVPIYRQIVHQVQKSGMVPASSLYAEMDVVV